MTHWCIIPARSGSTRIPGKNTRRFFGVRMLDWALLEATKASLFDKIVVSSDEMLGESWGAVTCHLREGHLAHDDVGTLEVTQAVARDLGVEPHDFVCCIYPCAGPFIRTHELELGESIINGRPNNCAHVFAVGTDPLRDAGQWYWSTGYALFAGTPMISDATRLAPIPDERVCDINTEEDWLRAERMYAALEEGDDEHKDKAVSLQR